MDFRLRVFLSVARHLSFTKASKEMGVTQPAITKHIQELENTYGVQLLSRQGGKTTLTRHGGILQEYAERIVMEHELLRLEIGLPTEGLEGSLNVISDFASSGILLPDLLQEFTEKFPQVNIRLEVSRDPSLLAGSETDILFIAAQDATGTDAIKVMHSKELSLEGQTFVDFIGISLKRRGVPIKSFHMEM